jgi:hypothetical protein
VTTSEFLIAASRQREYDWVLLPRFISQNERGWVMQQLPVRVHPETQIIEVTCGNKQLWIAIRIEYTNDGSEQPLLDHSGRELRHSYGVVSDEPTTLIAANNAIDRIRSQIKQSLANFLELPTSSERNTLQLGVCAPRVSNSSLRQEEPTTMRTSVFVMGLAIILSLVSIAYGYHIGRTLPELSRRMEEAEKKVEANSRTLSDLTRRMGDAEKKEEAIEAKLRNPTDGASAQQH